MSIGAASRDAGEPRWADDTPPAERELYRNLRASLPPEVRLLPNVMITGADAGKPLTAEADLVVIDPDHGVLVVEVKGGTVDYDARHGVWRRREKGGGEIRDPVQQVNRAVSFVRRALTAAGLSDQAVPVRWAVATPECSLDSPGDSVLASRLLWDARALADPPRAVRGAQGLLGQSEQRIGEDRAAAIERTLRGRSVEGVPSAAAAVQAHGERVRALTASHRSVMNLFQHNRRVLVRGAAGTGKTVLALEMAAMGAARGDRVLLTCWHRLLGDHLRTALQARLREMGSPAADDVTADPTGRVVVQDLVGLVSDGEPPPGEDRRAWFYEELPDRLATELTGGPFDLMVLDEAQDPTSLWLLALAGVLRDEGRWYAFGDRQQDLFGTDTRLPEFLKAEHELRENFRNSVEIAEFAGAFGDVEIDCIAGSGPPVRYMAVPADRVVGRTKELAKKLVSREGFTPDRVAAVTLFHNEHKDDPEGLIACHREGRLLVTNSAAFKGMERDVVVLGIDIREDRTPAEHTRSIYAGATRARSMLVVVGDPDQMREAGLYKLAAMFKGAEALTSE